MDFSRQGAPSGRVGIRQGSGRIPLRRGEKDALSRRDAHGVLSRVYAAAACLTIAALSMLAGCCCETVVGNCRYVSSHGTCEARGECGGNWLSESCYVESAEDCRAAEVCAKRGLCGFDEAASEHCIAVSASDCEASTGCRTEGACTLVRGECAVTDPGCSRSEACRDEGRCHQGMIRAHDGVGMVSACVVDDARPRRPCWYACRAYGACTQEGLACLATRERDCRASTVCKMDGACALDRATHSCIATRLQDCEASSRCADEGRCRLLPGGQFCYKPTSPCEEMCDTEGRCKRVSGVCQPSGPDDCEASIACRVQGRCGVGERTCVPRSDADCEASQECAAFGRCEASWSWCVSSREPRPGPYDDYLCLREPTCRTEGRCLRTPDGRCVTLTEAKERGAQK